MPTATKQPHDELGQVPRVVLAGSGWSNVDLLSLHALQGRAQDVVLA